jgi:hypothetical protein
VYEQVIVGEAVAGQAKQVLKQVNDLIANVNTSTFDLMDLLHSVKKNAYYSPEFDSFVEYTKSLDLKSSRSYYLVKIKEAMVAADIPRTEYEKVGTSKLRIIARINLKESGAVEKIKTLMADAVNMGEKQVEQEVAAAQGLTGDDAMVWINIRLKKAARDEVVRSALDLAKKQIGSVGVDADGNAIDASDGSALESICGDFLSDPNNQFEEPDTMDAAMGIKAESANEEI